MPIMGAPIPEARPGTTEPALDDMAPAADGHEGHDPFPFGRDPWWGKVLILVIVFLPLAALAYAIVRLWGHGVGPLELGLLFGLWAFTGLGISVGFHRMLTHRAFEARPAAKAVLLLAGTLAVEGPPAGWAATHLRHHAKADREGDPHSPLDGFWHAHVGWMLKDRMVHGGLAWDKLMQDPIVAFFSRTWIFWTVVSFALPAAIGFAVTGTFMGAVDAFVWGGLIRIALMHHTTWAVNSIGHMFGTRPFRTTDRGANNLLVAILGWGEGWHNNHHAFPRSAYMGLRWWQVDPGGWLVAALKAMRLVRNVHHPTREERHARQRV
jgi:stearoyl-CoA desaturase (Delta-9 desaturase)